MVTRMSATYHGELRCELTHEKSHAKMYTDAPIDNHGKGESFSPTDLLASSMLTCIMTIIGIRAQSRNVELKGMQGSVEKYMASNPRRISRLDIDISLPNLDEEDRAWLIEEGCSCPVCHSISDEIELNINFN